MRQCVAGFVVGVMAALGLHPVRGDDQFVNGAEFPVSLNWDISEGVRMAPLTDSEASAGTLDLHSYANANGTFTLASRPRAYSFTELLLNESADPLLTNPRPERTLPLALALHDLYLLQRLLERGADPNIPLLRPVPPPLVQLFENDYVARVLSKDSRVTPLMLAVLTGQSEAVRLLLEHGADTQIHTQGFHMYPLDFAAEMKSIPLMQLILGGRPADAGREHHIVISLSSQKGWFLQGGSVLLETPVSTGRPGYATRPGEYVVTQKYRSWKSSLYKVPMPNFMRLNCGQTGLHGGVVPGVPASHGCIRLPPGTAATLYGIVQLGDRVSIVE